MRNCYVVFCALVVGVVSHPARNGYYQGKSGVLFGGYYSNPSPSNPLFSRGYSYNPQGSMTAVVQGDAVATNTFSGGSAPWGWAPNDQSPHSFTQDDDDGDEEEVVEASEEVSKKNSVEEVEVSEEPQLEEEVEPTQPPPAKKATKAPRRTAKKKKPVKQPPVANNEDHEEEEQQQPWSRTGSFPSFFFPVSISSPGGGALTRQGTGGGGDWAPSPPIAVANAVSTGKGGVASSHATAFADPATWAAFARGVANGNGGKRARRQGRS